MLVLINGKFTKNPRLPLTDELLRGYGVFETMRTFQKKALDPDQHLKRLVNSAQAIGLKIKFSKKELEEMLDKIVKKSPYNNQRLKIVALPDHLIIYSKKLKIDPQIYQGVSCMSIVCERSLPEIKSISYLASYLSHEKAAAKGYHDAILTDEKGEVYEGAYSNIFWFEGNTLCTRDDKVLKGITRDHIIKKSPFPIKFKKINIEKLKKCQEIFLTVSTSGIVPITKIDKTKIGNGKTGAKTRKLFSLFPYCPSEDSN